MTPYCEACIVRRKAVKTRILFDAKGYPVETLQLCREHWHMAKAMGVKYLIHANPALEAKIKAAEGRKA